MREVNSGVHHVCYVESMVNRYIELNMANRLRGVGVAFTICLISAPIAILVTIAFLPFWSWIETVFGIESIGHSGPAEWCYLVSYVMILTCASLIWWAIRNRSEI